MEEKYEEHDVAILGCGVTECMIGALLAHTTGEGKLCLDGESKRKVVHIGLGDPAVWNIDGVRESETISKHKNNREDSSGDLYCFDGNPLLFNRGGGLFKLLQIMGITEMIPFKDVMADYVSLGGEKMMRIPHPIDCGMLGLLDRRRFKKFGTWVLKYKQADPVTHKGMNALETSTRMVFKHFKLDSNVQLIIGHGICGFLNDSFLDEKFYQMIEKIRMYFLNVKEVKDSQFWSPFVSPIRGSRGLIEAFIRRALSTDTVFHCSEQVDDLMLDEWGKIIGVKCKSGRFFLCKTIIANPSILSHTSRVTKYLNVSRSFLRMKSDQVGALSAHILFHTKLAEEIQMYMLLF